MGGRPTRAQRAAITQRRSDAIDLKFAGIDSLTIGRKLAADPSVNSGGIAYPLGLGIEAYRKGLAPRTDGRLIELACKDVSKALSERGTALDESTDELRKLMEERLERLFFGVYRAAIRTGDLQAVERAVRIIERSSHLLGLNRPVRTEVSGPDGGAVQLAPAGRRSLGLSVDHRQPDQRRAAARHRSHLTRMWRPASRFAGFPGAGRRTSGRPASRAPGLAEPPHPSSGPREEAGQLLRCVKADDPPKIRSNARSGISLDSTRLPAASRPTV
ncbi:hypothetical protein ACWC98_12230 [Streptomyces goshikiensis]